MTHLAPAFKKAVYVDESHHFPHGASGRHRRTLQARIFSRAQPQVGKDEPVREVQCRQHATVVEKIMAVFGRVLASEGKAEDATAHSAF